MLAHEQLTADQVQLMVHWIYSLESGKARLEMSRARLSDAGSVTCRVASAKLGGTIELHCDSAKGELLARVDVKPTGEGKDWEEIITLLKHRDQRCDLVAVFANAGQTNLLSLDWIQFNSR